MHENNSRYKCSHIRYVFRWLSKKIIEAIVGGVLQACATPEIVEEYEEIVAEMLRRKQGKLRQDILDPFIAALELHAATSEVEICRDPDDDKFISCALDVKALYIVSGDKDLLTIGEYQGVHIITAVDFCERLL